MNCGRPDCTGVHNKRMPYADWCPSVKEKHTEAQARYKGTAKGMLTDMRYESNRRGTR